MSEIDQNTAEIGNRKDNSMELDQACSSRPKRTSTTKRFEYCFDLSHSKRKKLGKFSKKQGRLLALKRWQTSQPSLIENSEEGTINLISTSIYHHPF